MLESMVDETQYLAVYFCKYTRLLETIKNKPKKQCKQLRKGALSSKKRKCIGENQTKTHMLGSDLQMINEVMIFSIGYISITTHPI